MLIVSVPVAVQRWTSVYVDAAAVCAYVPTAREKPLTASSPARVVSDVAGEKVFAVTAIHAAGFCPGRIMYGAVVGGVVPTAPVELAPFVH